MRLKEKFNIFSLYFKLSTSLTDTAQWDITLKQLKDLLTYGNKLWMTPIKNRLNCAQIDLRHNLNLLWQKCDKTFACPSQEYCTHVIRTSLVKYCKYLHISTWSSTNCHNLLLGKIQALALILWFHTLIFSGCNSFYLVVWNFVKAVKMFINEGIMSWFPPPKNSCLFWVGEKLHYSFSYITFFN